MAEPDPRQADADIPPAAEPAAAPAAVDTAAAPDSYGPRYAAPVTFQPPAGTPSSFYPTQPNLPAPKEFRSFQIDDLTTAPVDYWASLDDAYQSGAITSDDVYVQRRQRQLDEESTLLQARREAQQAQAVAQAEAAPTAPDERQPTGPRPEDPLGQRGYGPFALRPDAGMLRRDEEGNVEVTLETTQSYPRTVQGPDERGQPTGPSPYAPNAIGWTGEDTDIVRGALRGPAKAIDAMGSPAAKLAAYITGLDIPHITGSSVTTQLFDPAYKAVTGVEGGEPTTTLGGLTQGTTQYLTVALPVGRAIHAALAGAEAAAALYGTEAGVTSFGQRMLHWALTAEGADVVADFLAFDPNDPRAANLFNHFFPDAPDIAKAVANYLAATGNEGELEGRLKNVLEGRLMSGTAAAVFATFKGLKLAREAVSKVPMPQVPNVVRDALDRLPRFMPPQLDEAGGVLIPGGEVRAPKRSGGPTIQKPPSLDGDVTTRQMAKGSNAGYVGVGDYAKRTLGVKDGNVFLDLLAVASQGEHVGKAEIDLAIDAFERVRRGEESGLPASTAENALPVRDMRRALDGDPNVVIVDQDLWRAYYPDQWEAAKVRGETSWTGTPEQYQAIQARVTQEATARGLNPSDLQAQLWAGIRLATDAKGTDPFQIQRRIDSGEIPRRPGQSVSSLLQSETVTRLAGVVAALVAGHYHGDTDEDQAFYALVAAGINPRGAKTMARELANLVPAAGALRNTQVAHEGQLKRAYHGTPLPVKGLSVAYADPNGLYGPGLYFTENPSVAGGTGAIKQGAVPGSILPETRDLGYAQPRGRPSMPQEQLADYFRPGEIVKSYGGWDRVVEFHPPTGKEWRWSVTVEAVDPKTGQTIGPHRRHSTVPDAIQAPNVHAVYLDIQRPFDIDAVMSVEEMNRIGALARDRYGAGESATMRPERDTGGSFYDQLQRSLGGEDAKARANEVLKAAGYDGITHVGGARTGTDPHIVWIAFHDDQVHSAFEVAAEARMAKTISGGGPAIVTPDDPRSMADQYDAAVIEARRGGPRTHELVRGEAQSLIDLGLASWDWIKSLAPGATLADERVTALVMRLAESAQKMRLLTKQALAATDPVEQMAHAKAVVQQLWTHAELDPKRIGVLTETGRSLAALTDPTSGLNQFLQQFEFLMRDTNVPHPDPMQVVRAIDAMQDPGQLAVLAKAAQKPGFWQGFNEYYINGLLWGPKTWMANFLGNTGMALWAIPERAVAARMGDERGIIAGEAFEMLGSLTTGIVNGWKLAATAFMEGESQFQKAYGTGLTAHADKIDNARKVISSQTFNLTGPPGQAVDAIGNFIRFPMRVLASTDDFFKVIAYNMELSAVAHREASMNLQTTHFATAKEASIALEAEKARIMADPPLSVRKSAENFALYQTLTKELGEGGKLIQQWANKVPGGRILAPIIATPINAFKWAGERTPLALATTSYWKAVNGADRAVADLAKSRVALGSMTMGVAALMAYGGLITGKGPSDPEQRKKLEDVNWKPYSLWTPMGYVGVNRLEPVMMLMTLAADYVDAMVNSDATTLPQWSGEAGWALTITSAKAMTSRTFVQGMAETMAFMSNPERMSDQFASRFLQSLLPASGLLRQVTPVIDPVMRETNGVMDRICSQTPGCSSTLPPRRTLLDAEPIYQTSVYGPIGISRGKADREMNAIIALDVHVPNVPDHIEQSIEIQAPEKDYWTVQRAKVTLGGKNLREKIAEIMDSEAWGRWNNAQRATRLEETIQRYHDRAGELTRKQFPVLSDSVRAAEKDAREKARQGKGEPMPTSPLIRSLTR